MATEESFFEFIESQNDKFVSIIVKLQAIIRGKCVRKQLNELRKLYENISKDIDGPEMEVVWSSNSLSFPAVKKRCAAQPAKDLNSSACDQSSKPFQRCVASFVAPTHQSHQGSQTHPVCDRSENVNKDQQMIETVVSREIQTECIEPTVAGAQSVKEIGLLKKDLVMLSAERDLPKHVVTCDVQCEEVENINSHPASECSERETSENYEDYNLIEEKVELSHHSDGVLGIAESELPEDEGEICQLKNTMLMELMWVQQAINSRKHYLRVKHELM